MMRDVLSRAARRAGLFALAGAGLARDGWGILVDDVQLDTQAERRPGTWVRWLETEIRILRTACERHLAKAESVAT